MLPLPLLLSLMAMIIAIKYINLNSFALGSRAKRIIFKLKAL